MISFLRDIRVIIGFVKWLRERERERASERARTREREREINIGSIQGFVAVRVEEHK